MKYISLIFSLLSVVATAQNFKVMTYNIRYDNAADGINSWSDGNRKEKVINIIQTQNPDILGVQEALNHQTIYLENQFKNYHRIGVGRDDGKKEGEYATIFFKKDKFKALDSGHFWLSQTPEKPSKGWDAACVRICSWVKLASHNKEFFVFNTHLDHEGKIAQQKGSRLLLKKIKKIAKNTPFLLMGDFNMTPDNPSIQKIAKQLYDTQEKALPEFKNKGTFNEFKPKEPLKWHIDYIFTSKEKIKTKNYTIIDQLIDDLYPSDHLPVIVEIEF